MTKENLLYVEDKVLRHCAWATDIMRQFKTREDYILFIKTWIIWNDQNGFIHLFGDSPSGCVIWRPTRSFSTKLEDMVFFERDGESLWVDFLWAPDQWDQVRAWLIASGKRYGGWQRRNNFKVHLVDIKRLCSKCGRLGIQEKAPMCSP